MTYCNSVLEFKRKAFKMGICERYKDGWSKATNNKDLADMIMTVQGADFICAVRNSSGCNDRLVLREAQVVITTEHDHTVVLHLHDRRLTALQLVEIRIDT